jgi:hypothetical protein
MVACGSVTAQAAETTLMLACEGTKSWSTRHPPPPLEPLSPEQRPPKDNGKEPVSTNVIASFKYQTVEAFGIQFEMGAWDDAFVRFLHSTKKPGTEIFLESFTGSINRMTGVLEATQSKATKDGWMYLDTDYSLKCRPARRMF